MVAGNKANNSEDDELDPVNAQILAILASNPDISQVEIGQLLGFKRSTICKRLKKLATALPDRNKWFRDTVGGLRALAPKCLKIVNQSLDEAKGKDKADLATRVLRGLGTLVDKQTVDLHTDHLSNIAAFFNLPDDKQREILEQLRIADKSADPDGEPDQGGDEPTPE